MNIDIPPSTAEMKRECRQYAAAAAAAASVCDEVGASILLMTTRGYFRYWQHGGEVRERESMPTRKK